MSGASMHALKLVALAAAYISCSAGLINCNKFLLSADRFPFAGWLTAVHMATTWTVCMVLYQVKPSFFPTMEKTLGQRMTILKFFVPISIAFALSMTFSNKAYQYCSIAFLQFMKETAVAWVFVASCMIGSQSFDRLKSVVLVAIVSGAALAITGEVKFVMIGFVCQAVSTAAEVTNILLKEAIMSGDSLKLDPLTFQIYVCPGCFVVLLIMNFFMSNVGAPAAFLAWWHVLIPNGILAFMTNVSIACAIKFASGYEFVLMGVVKDVVIVSTSSILQGDTLAQQQIIGFSIAICSIFYWSFMKICPDHPLVVTPKAWLGMDVAATKPINV